jgi:hypothetical protein
VEERGVAGLSRFRVCLVLGADFGDDGDMAPRTLNHATVSRHGGSIRSIRHHISTSSRTNPTGYHPAQSRAHLDFRACCGHHGNADS